MRLWVRAPACCVRLCESACVRAHAQYACVCLLTCTCMYARVCVVCVWCVCCVYSYMKDFIVAHVCHTYERMDASHILGDSRAYICILQTFERLHAYPPNVIHKSSFGASVGNKSIISNLLHLICCACGLACCSLMLD